LDFGRDQLSKVCGAGASRRRNPYDSWSRPKSKPFQPQGKSGFKSWNTDKAVQRLGNRLRGYKTGYLTWALRVVLLQAPRQLL